MTESYEPDGTEANDLRLLISDVGGQTGTQFIFSDEEVARFLAHRGGNVERAAALALRTIAANENLTSKRIKFLELETDGPAVAKELLSAAKALEDSAKEYDDEGEDADNEIIEWGVDQFSRRHLRGLST